MSRLARSLILSRSVLLAACLASLPLVLSGCYERVIRATGPGSDRYKIEESNQSSNPVDNFLFGPPSKNTSR